MGERAQELAARFEAVNAALTETVAGCSEEQWRRICPAEGWTVGVVAHHVAEDHALLSSAIQAVAIGLPMPSVTGAMVDQMNARHATQHAACTKEETLDLLRKNGAAAAAILRILTDAQLDTQAPHPFRGGEPWRAEDLVQDVLVDHVRQHGDSIRGATGVA